jgi:hypothetical protein
LKAPAVLVTPRGRDHLRYQAMPKFKPLPPLERLHELLEVVEIPPDKYGVWSGLVWKVDRAGNAKAGSVAGSPNSIAKKNDRSDWRVGIEGTLYLVSRVIYYMTCGEDPGDKEVDHKDQNWLNNNKWNLRLDVEGSIQQINIPVYRNNTSGVMGVYWHKPMSKWKAQVLIKGQRKHLGYYACKLDAARVVRDKWVELGWDKVGRKLPDLNEVQCGCGACT